MIQGNLRTKVFLHLILFPTPEIIGFGIGRAKGDDGLVQTFYLKPSCEFRSILIMLDFGQGKLNPPDAKKELANFFFRPTSL